MSLPQTTPTGRSQEQVTELEAQFLEALHRARHGLRFGSIEITVHEGKVTQIERKEKFRFQP